MKRLRLIAGVALLLPLVACSKFQVDGGLGVSTSSLGITTLSLKDLTVDRQTVANNSVQISGTAGTFWSTVAAYDADHAMAKLSSDFAPQNGSYVITFPSVKLATGGHRIAVMAQNALDSSAAMAVSSSPVPIDVSIPAPASSPAPAPGPAPAPAPASPRAS